MNRLYALIGVPAVILALVMVGCTYESLTPIDQAAPVSERTHPTVPSLGGHPFHGRCETTFNPSPLPPPPVHHQIDTGNCRLTALGRAVFHSVKDINIIAGTQTITEATFTAANGDILRAVGSGTSAPIGQGRVSFSATLTFIGGTGRFLHASGKAHVKGEAHLLTRTAFFEIIDGNIAYNASDRSDL